MSVTVESLTIKELEVRLNELDSAEGDERYNVLSLNIDPAAGVAVLITQPRPPQVDFEEFFGPQTGPGEPDEDEDEQHVPLVFTTGDPGDEVDGAGFAA